MLTNKQKQLLSFLIERIEQDGVSPSYEEICLELNLVETKIVISLFFFSTTFLIFPVWSIIPENIYSSFCKHI